VQSRGSPHFLLNTERSLSCRFGCARVNSLSIPQPIFAALARAAGAAKHLAGAFHAVANNFAPAMITFRRHLLNCAFEAVEGVSFSSESDLECLVVFVSAMFAFSHKVLFHSHFVFAGLF
jgi:hypothetical protein